MAGAIDASRVCAYHRPQVSPASHLRATPLTDHPPPLQLRTFGGLSLHRSGEPVGGAGQQPRRLAVLALLAVAGAAGMTRARLLGLLWPETDEALGRQALSQALYALRRDTGGQSLVTGPSETLRLDPDVITSDVGEFLLAAGRTDFPCMAERYAGAFLDGVYLADALGFERWVDDTRAQLAAQAQRAFESLAAAADAAGDHAAAAGWWRRLTEIDELRTRAALGLVAALVANGERVSALQHAERFAQRVREDLDTEPNPAVHAIARQLRDETNGVRPAPPAGLGGRYVLGREIGRGGMAVVYVARDVRHERDVAVKMLHPDVAAALGRERLSREILVTAALRHPHILPLFDSGEADGTLYYVMPLVDGESLRARLSRGDSIPVGDVTGLCREIADALAHAHARGVVHRDIKPENILVSEGHAVVADFGIARLVTDASHPLLTQAGFAVGTPAYMSPEQFTDGSEVDGRSDVFSLACVMFEMLAGRPPWIAASAQALLTKRLVEMPPLVSALRPDVPVHIADLLARALQPDPELRTATAAAFASALAHSGHAPSGVAPILIPEPPGALVGRERELAAAQLLLTRPDIRLLTVTGAGGAGKTRVALRLAREVVAHFTDGVQWVDLSAVTDPDQVLPALAASLGAREGDGRSALDAIVQTIAARHVLVLLDNVEQVVGGAVVLAYLLARCPRLTLLVTSRIRLRIRGEHEFFLAPLAAPRAGETDETAILESPAVTLFLHVATAANPGFAPDATDLRAIAAICTRLDGLPLAIELAASRCRILSPQAINARLDRRFDLLVGGARDLPSRHQTLRDAIAWGYDLLTPPQQSMLRALAVFAGGASFRHAAAVVDARQDEFLDAAQSLLDASLLRRVDDQDDEARFVMLESVREYAADQATAAGESATLRGRHLREFAHLAGALSPAFESASSGAALANFDRERENFSAALDYAGHGADATTLARMTLSLWRAWLIRGEWAEGRRRIAQALQASGVIDTTLHAELLGAEVALAQNQGEHHAAYAAAQRALTLWRAADDRAGVARALGVMGWLGWRLGAFADARRMSEESLALHREQGDARGIALALSNLGWISLFDGNVAAAVAPLEESLALRRPLGDARNVGFTLTLLGWATLRSGEAERAREILAEARALFDALGERQLLAFHTCITAECAMASGSRTEAQQLLATSAIPVFREIGDRWGVGFALGLLTDAATALNRLDDADTALAESRAVCVAIGDRYGEMLADVRALSLVRKRRGDEGAQTVLIERIRATAAAMRVSVPPLARDIS